MKRSHQSLQNPTNFERPHVKVMALLISLLLHFGIGAVLRDKPDNRTQLKESQKDKKSIKVQVIERPKKPATTRDQIVEAPLPETEPPEDEAFLGRQEHRTKKPQKLPPSQTPAGAEASRIAQPTPAAPPPQENSQQPEKQPSKQEPSSQPSKAEQTPQPPKKIRGILTDQQGNVSLGEGYAKLLPQATEIQPGYNDYIDDDSIPEGNILDVNTTEYKYVGYFTAVRKQVEFAFYDPRSSLRAAPRVQQQLISQGRVSFQGVSTVQITVERSGLVTATEIVSSSGDRELDEAWERILNMAAPFPPLPKHFKEDTLIFNYSLYYDFIIQDSQRIKRFHF